MNRMTLRRPAPPDGRPHVRAITEAGRPIGRLRYAHDPHHLVIHALEVEGGAPIVDALLAPYPTRTPPRLTHYGIDTLDMLRWYRDSHLAPGIVLTGTLGDERLPYDPLRCVDLDRPRGTVSVTAIQDASLVPIGAPDDPDLAAVHGWFCDPNPLLRMAAIRRLGLDVSLPEALTAQAHELALVNDASGVRQFAAVHLSGFSPRLRADPGSLLALFADPLATWGRLGVSPPADPGWSPSRTRRDARYAVGWIFANLVRSLQGADDWRHGALAELSASLGRRPQEDLLHLLVRDEDDADPDVHYAFGTPEPVGLLDWLRFAILRERHVRRHGPADAFAWLARDARLIVGHLPHLAEVVLGPS